MELSRTVETAVEAETGVVGVITVVDVGRRGCRRRSLLQGLQTKLVQLLLLLLLLLLLEALFGGGQFAGHRGELARMVVMVQDLARDALRRDA